VKNTLSKEKKGGKKKLLLGIVAIVVLFILVGSYLGDEEDSETATNDTEASTGEDGSWAIYWYLCGSDLESNGGFATTDLSELMSVELPKNVKVIIQTGGAAKWQNEAMSADEIGRYVYSSKGFEKVDSLAQANMGKADTLASFLKFCNKNYPADHKMVVFWDHGGGSTSGVSFDENYDYDSLTLSELKKAFRATSKSSKKNPPYDIIGFDTCLMATVDTAKIFDGIGRYMVASEETEPGIGWCYDGWVGELAKNTAIAPKDLGKAVCDTYYNACVENGMADEVTLSVTDLSKVSNVLEAYNMFGNEALINAVNDQCFFTAYARAAGSTENYGGNTEKSGYTDMADLGDFAKNSKDILPQTADTLLQAIDDAVVYQVKGPYRDHATGLSCFYSYSGNTELFDKYHKAAGSKAFGYFYQFGLTGQLSQKGYDYLVDFVNSLDQEKSIPKKSQVKKAVVNQSSLEDHEITITDDNYAMLDIGKKNADLLSEVNYQLAVLDEEGSMMIFLGSDSDVDCDWEKGVFKDNFRGVWGAIDDHLVYMEVIGSNDEYTSFSVPIKLNGEEYNLRVIYDYKDEEFKILGARKGAEDDGRTDKGLRKLKAGDEITTVHVAVSLEEEDAEPVEFEMDTFKVTKNTKFAETELGDGRFALLFEMKDAENKVYTSDAALFTVKDGELEYD